MGKDGMARSTDGDEIAKMSAEDLPPDNKRDLAIVPAPWCAFRYVNDSRIFDEEGRPTGYATGLLPNIECRTSNDGLLDPGAH